MARPLQGPRRDIVGDPRSHRPLAPAYVCSSREQYTMVANILHFKYDKRCEYDPWDSATFQTFRNWMVALIKLGQYADAEIRLRTQLRRLQNSHAGLSPPYLVLYCLLISCLMLGGKSYNAKDKAEKLDGRSSYLAYPPAREELEELKWVYQTGQDYLTLRESHDGLRCLVEVKDYGSLHAKSLVESRSPGPSQVGERSVQTPKSWWGGFRLPRLPISKLHPTRFSAPSTTTRKSAVSDGDNSPAKSSAKWDARTVSPLDDMPFRHDRSATPATVSPESHPSEPYWTVGSPETWPFWRQQDASTTLPPGGI